MQSSVVLQLLPHLTLDLQEFLAIQILLSVNLLQELHSKLPQIAHHHQLLGQLLLQFFQALIQTHLVQMLPSLNRQ
jgi:hypothetical protein